MKEFVEELIVIKLTLLELERLISVMENTQGYGPPLDGRLQEKLRRARL